MKKKELLIYLKGIHGVNLKSVEGIDPELVRSFLNHEDERVAANAVFLARLYTSQIAVSIFESALDCDREVVVTAATTFTVHLQPNDAAVLLEKVLTQSELPSVLRAAIRSASQLKLKQLYSSMVSAYEKLPEGRLKYSAKVFLDSVK